MRRIALSALAFPFALALAACTGDDTPGTPDSGEQCTCPAPAAAAVSYDSATSQLGATNVQDAIDELDQAIPPTVGSLIEVLDRTPASNPGLAFQQFNVECPRADDVALGGSCGAYGEQLVGTFVGTNKFVCEYQQTPGASTIPQITIVCLHKSP